MTNINSEQHINLDNLDEKINKDETKTKENDDDDDDKINNDDNNDFDIDNINIKSIEHPAQNKNIKWRLDTIFKNDLYCSF
ncbi:hypothetical protein GLOIN_2v1849217 [Rhizophagus clarus]|uniref:Uncharacterized protein n=1 Tax=Rhizophagus clarus TaxID=94130 RepID=A0A8H3LJ45_9GLOM|nr:hypothetical protein GLOIN_2v1849217 [Rhizophagus clarus]